MKKAERVKEEMMARKREMEDGKEFVTKKIEFTRSTGSGSGN